MNGDLIRYRILNGILNGIVKEFLSKYLKDVDSLGKELSVRG